MAIGFSANIILWRDEIWNLAQTKIWKPNSKSHLSAERCLLLSPQFEWCFSQTPRKNRGVWVKHHSFLVVFCLNSEIWKHLCGRRVVLNKISSPLLQLDHWWMTRRLHKIFLLPLLAGRTIWVRFGNKNTIGNHCQTMTDDHNWLLTTINRYQPLMTNH